MDKYTNRYLFIIYPIFSVLFTYFVYLICKKILKRKKYICRFIICAILVVSLVLSNVLNDECVYYFKNSDAIDYFETISEDADFIIIPSEEWLLVTYINLLYDSNQFFYAEGIDGIYKYTDNLQKYSSDKDLYIILDTTFLEYYDEDVVEEFAKESKNALDYIIEVLDKDSYELVHTTCNYDRPISIYKVK